jgi:hypothetical protein
VFCLWAAAQAGAADRTETGTVVGVTFTDCDCAIERQKRDGMTVKTAEHTK